MVFINKGETRWLGSPDKKILRALIPFEERDKLIDVLIEYFAVDNRQDIEFTDSGFKIKKYVDIDTSPGHYSISSGESDRWKKSFEEHFRGICNDLFFKTENYFEKEKDRFGIECFYKDQPHLRYPNTFIVIGYPIDTEKILEFHNKNYPEIQQLLDKCHDFFEIKKLLKKYISLWVRKMDGSDNLYEETDLLSLEKKLIEL